MSEILTAYEVCKELQIARSTLIKYCVKHRIRKIAGAYVLTPDQVAVISSEIFADGKRLPISAYGKS